MSQTDVVPDSVDYINQSGRQSGIYLGKFARGQNHVTLKSEYFGRNLCACVFLGVPECSIQSGQWSLTSYNKNKKHLLTYPVEPFVYPSVVKT